jgi:hypothetical protein
MRAEVGQIRMRMRRMDDTPMLDSEEYWQYQAKMLKCRFEPVSREIDQIRTLSGEPFDVLIERRVVVDVY